MSYDRQLFLLTVTAPPETPPLGAFGARPPVPVSDGLDTRPCKILDPRLCTLQTRTRKSEGHVPHLPCCSVVYGVYWFEVFFV